MAFRTLMLAGVALTAATVLAPAGVSAQNGPTAPHAYSSQDYAYGANRARDRNGYPRAGMGRDGYAREAYYEDQPPRRPTDRERRERCDRDSAGSLLGAIAGGLLGDSAGGRGSRGGPLRARDADRDCD